MRTVVREKAEHFSGIQGIIVVLANRPLQDRLREELGRLRYRLSDHEYAGGHNWLYIVDDKNLPRVPPGSSALLFTPQLTEDSIEQAAHAGCLGLVAPEFDLLQLKAVVGISMYLAGTMMKLEKFNTRLLRKLRERKLIGMAKEILQKRLRIGEEEAYKIIRGEAVKSRRTLGEVASDILLRCE